MVDDHAAAGAERQPLEVRLLGQVRAQDDDPAAGHDGRAADGEPADLLRGREVPLHQRGRQLDHPHVVEAVARVVAGQQGGHVDVQIEQVADGVAVLGAVQAPERLGPPRVRGGGGAGVERGLDVREQALVGGGLGTRRPSRGHGAGPELADHPLPHLGVPGHVVEGRRLERQPALQRPVVVAGQTVPVDERLLRAARLGRGVGPREPQPRQRECGRKGGRLLYAHVDLATLRRRGKRERATLRAGDAHKYRRVFYTQPRRESSRPGPPWSRLDWRDGRRRRPTASRGKRSVLADAERTVPSRVGCGVQRSSPIRPAW